MNERAVRNAEKLTANTKARYAYYFLTAFLTTVVLVIFRAAPFSSLDTLSLPVTVTIGAIAGYIGARIRLRRLLTSSL